MGLDTQDIVMVSEDMALLTLKEGILDQQPIQMVEDRLIALITIKNPTNKSKI